MNTIGLIKSKGDNVKQKEVEQCTFDATQQRMARNIGSFKVKSLPEHKKKGITILRSERSNKFLKFEETLSERAIKEKGRVGSLIIQCLYYLPTYMSVN